MIIQINPAVIGYLYKRGNSLQEVSIFSDMKVVYGGAALTMKRLGFSVLMDQKNIAQ